MNRKNRLGNKSVLFCFYPQPHKFFGDAEERRKLAERVLAVLFDVLVGDEKTHRKKICLILEAPHRKPRPRPQKVGVRGRVQKHVPDFVCDSEPLFDIRKVLIYMYKLLSANGVEIPVYRPQILEQNDNPQTPRQLKRVGGVVFFSDFLAKLFHSVLLQRHRQREPPTLR